jgi:hypothetical protein
MSRFFAVCQDSQDSSEEEQDSSEEEQDEDEGGDSEEDGEEEDGSGNDSDEARSHHECQSDASSDDEPSRLLVTRTGPSDETSTKIGAPQGADLLDSKQ